MSDLWGERMVDLPVGEMTVWMCPGCSNWQVEVRDVDIKTPSVSTWAATWTSGGTVVPPVSGHHLAEQACCEHLADCPEGLELYLHTEVSWVVYTQPYDAKPLFKFEKIPRVGQQLIFDPTTRALRINPT